MHTGNILLHSKLYDIGTPVVFCNVFSTFVILYVLGQYYHIQYIYIYYMLSGVQLFELTPPYFDTLGIEEKWGQHLLTNR